MPRAQTNCARCKGHTDHCQSTGDSERSRRYYEDNREAALEQQRHYQENNREAVAEKNRRYYEDNRETIAEYKRRYREDNRESLSEKQRRYYEDNREALLEKQRRYQDLTLMGQTRYERAGMTPEEQAAYLAECEKNLGKDFYEIVLGEGNDA